MAITKIEHLKALIERGEQLDIENKIDVDSWKQDCRVAIERIFGEKSRQFQDLNKVSWSAGYFVRHSLRGQSQQQLEQYQRDVQAGKVNGKGSTLVLLRSAVKELEQFGGEEPTATPPMARVEHLCNRFHHVVRQLCNRHDNRNTLDVSDEYDVQDLMHGLLVVDFEDIRPEEWTPSYAGGSSRMDFLLKSEQIIIEVKKTRQGLNARKLGEELMVDILRYQEHPDCKMLVCFVYDPEGLIANPRGVEHDLAKAGVKIAVRALIRP